jgi:uncharacterized protein (DUF924 family)
MKELSMSERTALAGYLLIGDVDAAYRLLNPDSKSDDVIFHRMALRWVRQPNCKKYLDAQRLLLSDRAKKEYQELRKEDPNDLDLTDRNNLLNELQLQYRAAGSVKEKSDILARIADITRMKQLDDKAEQEERVHFYLPLKECENCPHKNMIQK